jgi:hypothetical protein
LVLDGMKQSWCTPSRAAVAPRAAARFRLVKPSGSCLRSCSRLLVPVGFATAASALKGAKTLIRSERQPRAGSRVRDHAERRPSESC